MTNHVSISRVMTAKVMNNCVLPSFPLINSQQFFVNVAILHNLLISVCSSFVSIAWVYSCTPKDVKQEEQQGSISISKRNTRMLLFEKGREEEFKCCSFEKKEQQKQKCRFLRKRRNKNRTCRSFRKGTTENQKCRSFEKGRTETQVLKNSVPLEKEQQNANVVPLKKEQQK